jgi:hypothetical protein
MACCILGGLALLLTVVGALNPSATAAAIAQRGTATTETTTTTSLTVNTPAGVTAGDVMIVDIAQIGNSGTDPSLPGWTLIAGSNLLGTTASRGAVLYRVATASEASSYTFTLGAGVTSAVGAIVVFSGVDTSGTPFDVTPGTIKVATSSSRYVAANSITTATANAAVIIFGMAAASVTWTNDQWSTATSPGVLTEIADAHSAHASVGAAWAIDAAAGATGNGAARLSANALNGGLLLETMREADFVAQEVGRSKCGPMMHALRRSNGNMLGTPKERLHTRLRQGRRGQEGSHREKR